MRVDENSKLVKCQKKKLHTFLKKLKKKLKKLFLNNEILAIFSTFF
jgi:hypothetical protein